MKHHLAVMKNGKIDVTNNLNYTPSINPMKLDQWNDFVIENDDIIGMNKRKI